MKTLAKTSLALGAAASLMTFAGCSSDGESTPSVPPVASSSAAAPPTSAAPTTAAPSSPSGTSSASTATTANLLKAGATALDAVDGSKLVSIDSDGNGSRWDVTVVTDDGTENDLTVSGDGETISSGPRADNDSAADKTENLRDLRGAKLDYREAADRLGDIVSGGAVRELSLDYERGGSVWDATVFDADKNLEREISLDADNGEVISDETDD